MRRILLAGIHLFVGINALVAGVLLLWEPGGSALGLTTELLERAPFSDFSGPGLLLAGVVGGSALWAAARTLARRGPLPSLFAGAVLAGWILVQMALIRPVHPLQILMLALAVAQVGLALALPGREAEPARRFFDHRRIALVGWSDKPQSFARAVGQALEQAGYTVVPVRRGERVQGVPAAILMVPPAAALAVVEDCVAAGVEAVWFHRGVGAGSASPEAVARAKAAGLLVVTDACPLMYAGDHAAFHEAHRWLRERSAG